MFGQGAKKGEARVLWCVMNPPALMGVSLGSLLGWGSLLKGLPQDCLEQEWGGVQTDISIQLGAP